MRGMMRLALLGVPGAQGGGVTYLLRDEFLTDEAAPLTSPRTCEPGPGTLTVVQTDGNFAIADGKLVITPPTATGDGRYGFYSSAITRAAGRAVFSTFNLSTFGICRPLMIKTAANCTQGSGTAIAHGFYPLDHTGLLIDNQNEGATNVWATDTDTTYEVCVVLQTAGAYYFVKGGAYTNWTLLWVALAENTATLYVAANFYSGSAGTLDDLEVYDLTAPFIEAHGIATLNIASPVSGTEYPGDADGITDLTVTAPDPLSGSAALRYRVTDANNYWTAYLNDAGAFRADSVAAGTPTNRVNVASVAVAAEARTIRVITNGTKHNYYTLAGTTWIKRGNAITLSHQDTATAIVPEATDYTLGALRSYPTTSPAYAELDRT